jgi:hypothetical protein
LAKKTFGFNLGHNYYHTKTKTKGLKTKKLCGSLIGSSMIVHVTIKLVCGFVFGEY